MLPTEPGQKYDPGHKSASWWLQEIERPFDRWGADSKTLSGKSGSVAWNLTFAP